MARVPHFYDHVYVRPDNDASFSLTLTIGILAQSTILSRFEWKSLHAVLPLDRY